MCDESQEASQHVRPARSDATLSTLRDVQSIILRPAQEYAIHAESKGVVRPQVMQSHGKDSTDTGDTLRRLSQHQVKC